MPKIVTLGESLYWSYANLGMAHAALTRQSQNYGQLHYMIRSRLYKGLIEGKMNIGHLMADEKLKLKAERQCSYCYSMDNLSIDHMIPSAKKGSNYAENLILACKTCNSSKGSKDFLVWYSMRDEFPALMLLRRYLKLCIELSRDLAIMEHPLEKTLNLPFDVKAIPHNFPPPNLLKLW